MHFLLMVCLDNPAYALLGVIMHLSCGDSAGPCRNYCSLLERLIELCWPSLDDCGAKLCPDF